MEGMENATWHEGAHVRDMALSYALLLLRSRILTTDNYLQEAGKMWDFLRAGEVPMPVLKAEDFPDDLSSLVPAPASEEKKSPMTFADFIAGQSQEVDDVTKNALAQIFGVDPDVIKTVRFHNASSGPPSDSDEPPSSPLGDAIVEQEWDGLDRTLGYATNPNVVQKHTPGIVDDNDDEGRR